MLKIYQVRGASRRAVHHTTPLFRDRVAGERELGDQIVWLSAGEVRNRASKVLVVVREREEACDWVEKA